MSTEDQSLLAEEGGVIRQRSAPTRKTKGRWQPGSDWNPDLPYGGKVYLARRKKDDPLWVKIAEVSA